MVAVTELWNIGKVYKPDILEVSMESLSGRIEKIQYYNSHNGFGVIKVDTPDEDLVTAIGRFASINPGDEIKMEGMWTIHPQYGIQFKVESYSIKTPTTKDNLIKYLASGLIKGIGETTAKRIVNTFGLDALNVLENEPHRLMEVEGIGEKKAEMILESFTKQLEIKETMMYLQGLGISPRYCVKIYKFYGDKTISMVKENPYRLADDIFGIGFKKADAIALAMGIAQDSPYRISAAIEYVLAQGAQDGHVFLLKGQLLEELGKFLEIEEEKINEIIEDMTQKEDIVTDNNRIYLYSHYKYEKESAEIISKLNSYKPDYILNLDEMLNTIQIKHKISYHNFQKEAIKTAACNPMTIITGGPGTGKTTIIKGLIEIFKEFKLKVALAAPTGRAAKRMSETSGYEAKTIHRLLEMSFNEGLGPIFQKDQDDPIEKDVIILDEVSMVDIQLLYYFLRAVKFGTRIIMVGDSDQLPSVGPGNVLRDLIDSKVIPTVRLTEIFRQSEESYIVLNAHKINSGKMPYLEVEDTDFYFIPRENPEEIIETIKEICLNRIPKRFGIPPIDIQVLTPMRGTLLGVKNLNSVLQDLINPQKDPNGKRNSELRRGDKVMQLKNNYQKEVYNGDIGIITDIAEDGVITVEYPAFMGVKEVKYGLEDIDEITLAYATTVHKSQGSEYRAVIMPVSTQHYIMLQRNLLYTAVTRAKEVMVMVGTKKALAMGINRINNKERNSMLSERLKSCGGVKNV